MTGRGYHGFGTRTVRINLVLKLTKKADYGLIALRHLASIPGATASTKDIADAYHFPVPLLAKVLQQLTRAGILQSVAGTNGGYKLARDARRISALEVVRAIDGPVILTHCFTEHGNVRSVGKLHCSRAIAPGSRGNSRIAEQFTITDLAESPAVKSHAAARAAESGAQRKASGSIADAGSKRKK